VFFRCRSLQGKRALGIGWNNFSASELYEEYSIVMSYGVSLGQLFSSRMLNAVCVGLNAKYLFHKFILDIRTANDPVFQDGSNKSNVDFDFGILFRILFPASMPDLSLKISMSQRGSPGR